MLTSFDKPKSNCGVFGAFNDVNASFNSYYALIALQHRGQEACGITSNYLDTDRSIFFSKKGKGLVNEVFNDLSIFSDLLKGNSAIGHNRYSTTGADTIENIQPFNIRYKRGNLSVAHNGNLTNYSELRRILEDEGSIFRSTSDTEVFLHLISKSKAEKQYLQILEALNKVVGAFSLVLLTEDSLYGARDKYGVRPLVIGKLNDSYFLSSETAAFDLIRAEYIREVLPGELVQIDNSVISSGVIKSYWIDNLPKNKKKCIFEYIYFSRPDSILFGENVDKVRRNLGKSLASEHYLNASEDDKLKVISVPDSSNTIAIGFQDRLRKMNIPSKLEIGLIRSHYIGRTFIQPGQDRREISVRIKFNTVKGVLQNKRIIIVDDSIVRGTTSKKLINLIKEAKPKEIHLRISSPPILFPCQYGMDFPSREELIAHRYKGNIEEIEKEIGVDSLRYLSLEGLVSSVPDDNADEYCLACFTGNYPIPIDLNFHKNDND